MQFRMQMLQHDEHRLDCRVGGDVTISLLIAQHSKLEIVDVIGDQGGKLVDLLIGDELIRLVLKSNRRKSREEMSFRRLTLAETIGS